jgi:hypothetical protein
MKKNLVMILLALSCGIMQAGVKFHNNLRGEAIHVQGVGGISYKIEAGKARDFQTGLRDELIIKAYGEKRKYFVKEAIKKQNVKVRVLRANFDDNGLKLQAIIGKNPYESTIFVESEFVEAKPSFLQSRNV